MLLWLTDILAYSQPNDSVLAVLDRELLQADHYVDLKIEKIYRLRQQLKNESLDAGRKLSLYQNISDEYRSFHFDSAFKYTRELNQLAYRFGNQTMINISKVKMAFILQSSGMFKESIDTLFSVDNTLLEGTTLLSYFTTAALSYYSLSDLLDDYYHPVYEQKAALYVDSILMVAPGNSYEQLYFRGLRNVRQGNFEDALPDLKVLQKDVTPDLHKQAIVNSTMSDIYINLGENQTAIDLLARSAIFDIRSATRETAAILNLANLLYQQGDIQRAYIYTKRALEDANFYGARHRKIQVGSILPIIEEEMMNIVERQKRRLLFYSVISTVLVFVVVVSFIVIQRQLQKIKKAERKLHEANRSLSTINRKLVEANKIKEEYLGYYFSLTSVYIEKLEKLKFSLESSLGENNLKKTEYIAREIDPQKERAKLYEGFDSVFLKLFPDFISEFNALLNEGDRITPGEGELLTTDLRIFALTRLGISENDKIARILDFSVNTIYTYKTRIRKKAIVPNEEFERKIMEIKVFK
ncbi:MAG: helix-turn-helix transcriptional regulator [Bacteroidales bacterium]|nr:helix-turn-helix transcriptional regulator [Bacteroidales bacterium]